MKLIKTHEEKLESLENWKKKEQMKLRKLIEVKKIKEDIYQLRSEQKEAKRESTWVDWDKVNGWFKSIGKGIDKFRGFVGGFKFDQDKTKKSSIDWDSFGKYTGVAQSNKKTKGGKNALWKNRKGI